MKKRSLLAISALTLSGMGALQASNFNNSVGLSGVGVTPLLTVTFDSAPFAKDSNAASSFAGFGVTFSTPVFYDGNTAPGFGGCSFNDMSGDCISNFSAARGNFSPPPTFSIFFSTVQTAAAFALVTDNNGTNNTTFRAYKGASLVEAQTYTTASGNNQTSLVPNFFGFYGTTGFDSIVLSFTGQQLAVIDNIQLASVPEPGTIGLLALGLSGVVAIARRRRSS